MKKILMGGYFAIAFLSWIYLANWGAFAYRGWAYNFGRALVWPAIMFPAVGQILGAIVVLALVVFATFFMRRRPT